MSRGAPNINPIAIDDEANMQMMADGVDGIIPEEETVNTETIYSVQSMAEVLKTGSAEEKEFVLFELQQLLDHCFDDTLRILVPILCRQVLFWTVELQFKAAEAMLMIVTNKVPSETAIMVAHCARRILRSSKPTLSSDDAEMFCDVWGDVLLEVVPDISWDGSLRDEMVSLVETMYSSDERSRKRLAGRLVGALAQVLEEDIVESKLLPVAVSLCEQGGDVMVRGTAGEAFAALGASLKEEVVNDVIWPRIVEFLKDDDFRILGTAIRTVSTITREQIEKEGPKKLFLELLPPVVDEWCRFAIEYGSKDQRLLEDEKYTLLTALSEEFGQLLYSVWYFQRARNLKVGIKGYFKMSVCNGPAIRRSCAFNIPGVSQVFASTFTKEMCDLVDFFSKDGDEEVRWNIASGLHETVRLLAPDSTAEQKAKLMAAFERVVLDKNALVRMQILEHFADILKVLATGRQIELEAIFLKLHSLCEGAWRIQELFANQVAASIHLFPHEVVETALPLLYDFSSCGTALVRKAGVVAMIRGLRYIPNVESRNAAINRYWKGLANHGKYWAKQTLLEGGRESMGVFSSIRFRELFAKDMLELASDPVPNIRLKVASLLPQIAPRAEGMAVFQRSLILLYRDNDTDIKKVMKKYEGLVELETQKMKENQDKDYEMQKAEDEFYGESKARKPEEPSEADVGADGQSKADKFGSLKVNVKPLDNQLSQRIKGISSPSKKASGQDGKEEDPDGRHRRGQEGAKEAEQVAGAHERRRKRSGAASGTIRVAACGDVPGGVFRLGRTEQSDAAAVKVRP
mmetsp:Transcript_22630/g.60155  ORF Transcript_22630/g.60155 Transcript_22630/m.60155 type:complete len:802 (+) Transcript_22630:392-2797(+)